MISLLDITELKVKIKDEIEICKLSTNNFDYCSLGKNIEKIAKDLSKNYLSKFMAKFLWLNTIDELGRFINKNNAINELSFELKKEQIIVLIISLITNVGSISYIFNSKFLSFKDSSKQLKNENIKNFLFTDDIKQINVVADKNDTPIEIINLFLIKAGYETILEFSDLEKYYGFKFVKYDCQNINPNKKITALSSVTKIRILPIEEVIGNNSHLYGFKIKGQLFIALNIGNYKEDKNNICKILGVNECNIFFLPPIKTKTKTNIDYYYYEIKDPKNVLHLSNVNNYLNNINKYHKFSFNGNNPFRFPPLISDLF